MPDLGFGEWLVVAALFLASLFLALPWPVGAAVVAALSGWWLVRRWQLFRFWAKRGVKGPSPTLLMGNINDYQRDGIWQCDLKWSREFGKVYGVYSGAQPELMITDPDLLRQFFIKDFANFADRGRGSSSVTKSRTMFAKLLTVLKGERWKEVRATVQPAFSHPNVKMMAPLVLERLKMLADVLGEKATKSQPFKLHKVFEKFTMDCLASVVFGVEANAQKDDSSPFLDHANESINIISLDNWKIIVQILFSWTLLKINQKTGWQLLFREGEKFFSAIVQQIKLERGRNPAGRADFIGLLLASMEEAKYDDPDEAPASQHPAFRGISRVKLTIQETAAQCFIFLAAGYDTTALALQFAVYNLTLHQHIQDKLRDEICDMLRTEEAPTYEEISKLPYLDAVLKESLRMYPPGLRCERRAAEDCTLGGFEVAKGTSVVVPILAIHHSPEFYPDPETFNPDRFLGAAAGARDPMTFLPFGHGARDCVGQRWAVMVTKMTLAFLLPRFTFLVEAGDKADPMNPGTLLPPLSFAKFGFLKPDSLITVAVRHRF